MRNHHQVDPAQWARYKAKCAQYAPRLAMLRDLFEEIAAGKHYRKAATEFACRYPQCCSQSADLRVASRSHGHCTGHC
jgi:acyl carrier protein phosphodiesterase